MLLLLLLLLLPPTLGKQPCHSPKLADRSQAIFGTDSCTAEKVRGEWCQWEPAAAHSVGRCQPALGIRWRRRLCRCPPPFPVHDSAMSCDSPPSRRVAKLRHARSREDALAKSSWERTDDWEVKEPFQSLQSVTNSQLGCIRFENCNFDGFADSNSTGPTCSAYKYLGVKSVPHNDLRFKLSATNARRDVLDFSVNVQSCMDRCRLVCLQYIAIRATGSGHECGCLTTLQTATASSTAPDEKCYLFNSLFPCPRQPGLFSVFSAVLPPRCSKKHLEDRDDTSSLNLFGLMGDLKQTSAQVHAKYAGWSDNYNWTVYRLTSAQPVAVVLFKSTGQLPEVLLSDKLPSGLSQGNPFFTTASPQQQRLWRRCDTTRTAGSWSYSSCSPQPTSQYVMLRSGSGREQWEMRQQMGFDWLARPAGGSWQKPEVWTTTPQELSCLVMHHPPGGPDRSDYESDQFSFDETGAKSAPAYTPSEPTFSLPAGSLDGVSHGEQTVQEDWDVLPCGDWQLMRDTSIVGVPIKFRLAAGADTFRGRSCYSELFAVNGSSGCNRKIYFRVDSTGLEVLHYPDFGRSYQLAEVMENCQFACAVMRECKAFEFRRGSHCSLHLISFGRKSALVHSSGTVYGRKGPWLRSAHPFTSSNAYHPFRWLVQDLRRMVAV